VRLALADADRRAAGERGVGPARAAAARRLQRGESDEAKPGDLVVLQAAGAGCVGTTVVLEILETPRWDA
jgi:hypothetical protein